MVETRSSRRWIPHFVLGLGVVLFAFPIYMALIGSTHDAGTIGRGDLAARSAHHQVVIVGGGTAGITVAARLRRGRAGLDIAIVEPSEQHDYQPLWTLVGAGIVRKEAAAAPRGR